MGYANGFESTLSVAITDSATTLTLVSVTGLPPLPCRGHIEAEGANTTEVVLVTAVSGSDLTIVRGYELYRGNGASGHGSGAIFAAVVTAGELNPVHAAARVAACGTFR